MPLSHITLEALDEKDLNGLLAAGVPEGRRIEYKRELPGRSDGAKSEFVADVTSFANAAGGDILYGIEERSGIPTAIPGISDADPDASILRLEQLIRSGAAPRIPGVHIRSIPLVSGRFVLVIRIPRSWMLPHMVTVNDASRFFSRTSAGKAKLDVHELRALFLRSSEAGERIRRFRDERLSRLLAGEGAFPMKEPAFAVLHMIPLGFTEGSAAVDIQRLARELSLSPLAVGGWNSRFNLDGFATSYPGDGEATSYAQAFRHGAIEAASCEFTGPIQDNDVLYSERFGKELVTGVESYLRVQKQLGVDLPIVLLITLVGVRGFKVATGDRWWHRGTAIDRDVVPAPEVFVDDWDIDVPAVLRPALDAIWNAGGHARCDLYDAEGRWTGV